MQDCQTSDTLSTRGENVSNGNYSDSEQSVGLEDNCSFDRMEEADINQKLLVIQAQA